MPQHAGLLHADNFLKRHTIKLGYNEDKETTEFAHYVIE